MSDNKISITLPVDEWNIVMNALGSRPFAEVTNVVAAIQSQAASQVPNADIGDPPVKVEA